MDITNINIIKNSESGVRVLIEVLDDNIIATPEDKWTDDQKAIVAEFEKQFPNGRPLPTSSEPQNEPIDTAKVAMAEAIIDLSSQIDDLKNQINKLSGGK